MDFYLKAPFERQAPVAISSFETIADITEFPRPYFLYILLEN